MPRNSKNAASADEQRGDVVNWLSGKIRILEGKLASQNDALVQMQAQMSLLSKLFLFIDVDELRSKIAAVHSGSEDTLAESIRLASILEVPSAQTSRPLDTCIPPASEVMDLAPESFDISDIHLDQCELDYSLDFVSSTPSLDAPIDSHVTVDASETVLDLGADVGFGNVSPVCELNAAPASLQDMLGEFSRHLDGLFPTTLSADGGVDTDALKETLKSQFVQAAPMTIADVEAFLQCKVIPLLSQVQSSIERNFNKAQLDRDMQIQLAQSRLNRLEVAVHLEPPRSQQRRKKKGR